MIPNPFAAIVIAVAIQAGIVGMGDDSFETRQASSALVESFGPLADAQLREAVRKSDDLEIRYRAGKLLNKLYEKKLDKRVSDGDIPSILTLPDRHKVIREWCYAQAKNQGSANPGVDAMKYLVGRASPHLIWDYFDLRTGDTEADEPTNLWGMNIPVPPFWIPGPQEPTEDQWASLIKDISRR